jgi:ApaG protein
MQGKYQMLSDSGESFKAAIPKFTLSIPRILH